MPVFVYNPVYIFPDYQDVLYFHIENQLYKVFSKDNLQNYVHAAPECVIDNHSHND